jgi:hypothetical protein
MKQLHLNAAQKLLARAGLIAACALPAASALADATPVLSELSAQWWQLVLSVPTTVNPVADATGDNCMVGERGPIWFLYGTFGASSAVRTCAIPEGKFLFFPVINNVQVNTPNICGQTGALTTAQIRQNIAPLINDAKGLSVTVDGQPIRQVERVKSVPFAVSLPIDNIFVGPCGGDSPPGVFSPAADDGYYALVPALRAGTHTLRILASSDGFSLDVTYHLTVVPVSFK